MSDGWAIWYGTGLKQRTFTFDEGRVGNLAASLHGVIHAMSYDPMNVSAAGLDLIKEHESCRLISYPDPATGGDPWTIGWGHAHGVKPGDICTQEQADEWLQEDADIAAKAVLRHVVPALEQNQLDALASFVFNLGEGNFSQSTLLKKVNAEDWEGAAEEFKKWDHAAGRQMAGLTKRRLAESELFLA